MKTLHILSIVKTRSFMLYAINEAGFEIDEMIYLRWDPFKYSYEYVDAYNRDSVIYVLRKS